MKSCSFSIKTQSSKATKALRNYYGNNTTEFMTTIDLTIKGQDDNGVIIPSDAFKTWYSDNYNKPLDFNAGNGIAMRNAMVKFAEEHKSSAAKSSTNTVLSRILVTYGYQSANARVLAKRIAANWAMSLYTQTEYNIRQTMPKFYDEIQKDIKENGIKTFYFTRVREQFVDELIARIIEHTGEDEKVIRNRIKTEGRKYVENSLGNAKMSLQDKNLVAFVYEFVTNGQQLVEEICRDSRLNKLRFDKGDEFHDLNDRLAVDAVESAEGADLIGTEPVDDDVDLSFSMYDHSGTFKNAMMHINENVKMYFDSLSRQTSNGTPDTNNELGLADAMTASECASVIYHYARFLNVADMINSIQEIADTLPGFKAFHALAQDMKDNKNLAFELYSVFGKLVITKSQTYVENGRCYSKISNVSSNKLEAFKRECMNTVKWTVLNTNLNQDTQELNTLLGNSGGIANKHIIDTILTSDNVKIEFITRAANLLRQYYPNITTDGVYNYVTRNKEVDKDEIDIINNLNNVLNVIKSTIQAARQTRVLYDIHIAKVKEIDEHNEKLKAEDDMAILSGGKKHKDSDYRNIEEAYAESYISEAQNTAALNVAELFVNYSLVKVDSNSTNSAGNNSSDVINNSMLTNLMFTLQNKLSLMQYGKNKLQDKQYKYSNILLEERDDNNKIIHKGLFTYNDRGILVPTYYAQSLLKATLFNGAKNFDNGTNIDYANMSEIDYIITAYSNFFNSQDNNTEVADYFMRTPADAQRNFEVSAPRYSTKGLFSIKKADEIKDIKTKFRNRILNNKIDDTKLATASNGYPIKIYNINDIVNHWFGKQGKIKTAIPKWLQDDKHYNNGDHIIIQLQYANSVEKQNLYMLSGTYKDGYLIDGTFEGIYNPNNVAKPYSSEVGDALNEYIEEGLNKRKLLQRAVDVNHPIFKMYKNIFKKELLGAAIALNKFFKLDANGIVQYYTAEDAAAHEGIKANSIIWNDGHSNDAANVKGAYEFYHYKDGVILKEENGRQVLVGNVFHSDKFIIFDEESNTARNYGEEILNEAFDFLYGGAKDEKLGIQKYLRIVKDGDNVVDITLAPEQERIIDEKLTEFLTNYVEDTTKRIKEKIIDNPYLKINFDTAAEFILNYRLQLTNNNDLFEGDTKFYEDYQKFFKRAKEGQGSGNPYGISDYARELGKDKAHVESALDKITWADGSTVKLFDGFNAVTIKNTIKSDYAAIAAIEHKLIHDCKVDESLVHSLLKPYGNGTTVNDAQSYITFDEWIRRITAKGQLDRYKDLIDKIKRGEEIVAEDVFAFIQVQKNFYFDQHFDKAAKTTAPIQIKNAEFVLIPQLIRGTELETVAELMAKYKIDQLNTFETSKAGNADVLEVFDAKTGDLKQDIVDEIERGQGKSLFGQRAADAIHTFNYNHLYTQQETPQHMADKNKVGIQVIKKLFDNIPDSGHPLSEIKKHFFTLYSTKIKHAAQAVFDELEIERDENGNLILEDDGTGYKTIKGLNAEVFYKRLKEELLRRNTDSNMLDYVTLDETQVDENGFVTLMPNYCSNVSQVLENIVQSMFNRRIVRQTLPGFHAAQITNVGWKPKQTLKTNVVYGKRLHYHTDDKGNYVNYVEVMLPASAFKLNRKKANGKLKTKEELLKELQKSGLDILIGYRIPTEGKQSIAKMKVVGLLDDAFGSTIVVPDDWVTQTGSDFDIDSVYGIQRETYIDAAGHIRPIKFKNKEKFTIYDWFRYIRKHTGQTYTFSDEERIKEIHHAEEIAYSALDDDTKYVIQELHKQLKSVKSDNARQDYADKLYSEIVQLNDLLNRYTNDGQTERIDAIKNYIATLNVILADFTLVEDVDEFYNNVTNSDIKNILEKYATNRLNYYKKLAKENDLKTFEEYLANVNPYEDNTDAAIDNEIVECCLTVLSHDSSLEENISRSNSDDLDAAIKGVQKYDKTNRNKYRTPYDFLDQASYQEEATSAMALKGASVARDTFNSMCNTVQPILNDSSAIKIKYQKGKIDSKTAINRFGIGVSEDDNGIIIKHTQFGWSNDYRNIVGKLLTPYSSQTTAYILDIIKKGGIPNVNTATFGVFKMFSDIGSDFETAMTFMKQNGITRIVNEINKNKSIYYNDSYNPIETVIKQIAEELGFLDAKYKSLKEVLEQLNKNYHTQFANIFGQKIDISLNPENLQNIVIDVPALHRNLNRPLTNPTEAALFDLGVILTYYKLNKVASKVSRYLNLVKPDKFGTKQTIFATNKIVADLYKILREERDDESNKTFLVGVDRKGFLESIYPDIEKGIDAYMQSDNNKSAYPYMNLLFKYATCASIKINRTLFATQKSTFRKGVNALANYFTYGNELTEEEYKDFEKYVLGDLYINCQAISRPITYNISEDKKGFVAIAESEDSDITQEELFRQERARVLGIGVNPNTRFTVNDINHPKQDEVNAFAKLSPAQKIMWIKENFNDAGLFNHITADILLDGKTYKKKVGQHILQYIDSGANIEDTLVLFETAFNHSNPLVALAAFDVVKYAVIKEGRKMTKGGVDRTIANSVLYNPFGVSGTGFVDEVRYKIDNIDDLFKGGLGDIYDDYIRSHDISKIPTVDVKQSRVVKNNNVSYVNDLQPITDNIMHIDNYNQAYDYKIAYETDEGVITNSYVKLKFRGKDAVLYKIVENESGWYLYPLNKLDSNEHGEFSVVYQNIYRDRAYYEKVINDTNKQLIDNAVADESGEKKVVFDKDVLKKTTLNTDRSKHTAKTFAQYNKVSTAKPIDVNNPTQKEESAVTKLKNDVQLYFGDGQVTPAYVLNDKLSRFIKDSGENNGRIETFILNEGTENERIVKIKVYKLSSNEVNKHIRKYVGTHNRIENIKEEDKKYTDIITTLRGLGLEYNFFSPIYRIELVSEKLEEFKESETNPIRKASIEETTVKWYDSLEKTSRRQYDDLANIAIKQLKDRGIEHSKSSIAAHQDVVISATAEYCINKYQQLNHDLTHFVERPNGGYYSIIDPDVIKLIKDDPILRNKYLTTLLEAEAFFNNFKQIYELNIDSQNPKAKEELKSIKECIGKLQANYLINTAKQLFAKGYLNTLSKDYLIQQQIADILNGFNSTNGFTSWIGDLQENTSPLIQVISKQVMINFRAKQSQAVSKVRALRRFMANIREEAAAAGKTIDLNHIIKDGRFIRVVDNKFLDDLYKLRDNIDIAKNTFGEGSIEHLRAELEYDKWKLKHVNREIEDSYYEQRIALTEQILKTAPDIYSEYNKLEAKKKNILSHEDNGVLDNYWQPQLDEVEEQINYLLSDGRYDSTRGGFISKPYYDDANPLTGTPEEQRQKRINSRNDSQVLRNYLKDIRRLNSDYHDKEAKAGFEDKLKQCLRVIESYEQRGTTGASATPLNLLLEHEDYANALSWLQSNARSIISLDSKFEEDLNKAFKTLRRADKTDVVSSIAKKKKLYDVYGIIDATKLTPEEIKAIKDQQEREYKIDDNNAFSDRILISNSEPNPVIYTADFYRQLHTDSIDNPEWLRRIKVINDLLTPYLGADGKIDFSLVPDNKDGIKVLRTLHNLYYNLAYDEDFSNESDERLTRKIGASKEERKAVRDFIEKNVEFEADKKEFALQQAIARSKSNAFYTAWEKANTELDENGNLVPNHYIYGYMKPKKEVEDKYIDKDKTDALKLIHDTFVTKPTQYYIETLREMRNKGDKEFNAWYEANHIFNPYTHSYEPIACWIKQDYKEGIGKKYWEPKYQDLISTVREDKRNPNYKPNGDFSANYKEGSGYDNPEYSIPNEYERRVRDEFKRILTELSTTEEAKRFIMKDYLPALEKAEDVNAKYIGKEMLRSIGWIVGKTGEKPFKEDMSYNTDVVELMPMLHLLEQKTEKDVNLIKPVKSDNETDAEFAARVEEYTKAKHSLAKENAELHKNAIDNDWEKVMETFIMRASHFNAIQDNKAMLYYGHSMLKDINIFKRKYEMFGDYKKDSYNGDDENDATYVTTNNNNALTQYDTWVRRLIFEQWKETNGAFTKWATRIQGFTSAQYMMLNVRGGIGNVTVGRTQILAERFAGEYIGHKEWLMGEKIWSSGIVSYLAHLNDDKSSSVADAVAKFMNVIDEEAVQLRSNLSENPTSKFFTTARKFAYSTLSSGEHYMQNSVLFAMMLSHRLYKVVDANGKVHLEFKNEQEAIRDADILALKTILSDEQKGQFDEFIKKIKIDPNVTKEYIHRNKNVVTEFVKQLSNEQKEEYVKVKKEIERRAKDDFNNDKLHPTLWSQVTLGDDQMMSFKPDSLLAEFNIAKENGEPSDAYNLLADFRGRVISVNKKIHGVYEKLGQAQLEKTWLGSLIMQYHKHLYPGILKRWRKEGYFNEARGTVEKGAVISLLQFITTPIRNYKEKANMTDAQVDALTGIQNFAKEVVDFATNFTLNYNLLPSYEQANMHRLLGDLYGVLIALFGSLIVRLAADDDDEDDVLYNLALYEFDRLASESRQFSPLGAISEAKKLWSSPIAAQSRLEDLVKSTKLFVTMIAEGEDFDPYYHSGQYAGEHKLSVYLQRSIPIWRGVKTGFIDIVDSNRYYKMDKNILGVIPIAKIVEDIKE